MSNLIHVMKDRTTKKYYYLRQENTHSYAWFHHDDKKTNIIGENVEDAIRLGRKLLNLTPINCGFVYTLPERDEHGMNALFHQMVDSYSSMTGVYFDRDLGNNCIVKFASQEALNLWKNDGKRD